MLLRYRSAGRRHVARIAAVSLISLGLVGLGGAANAGVPGDPVPQASDDPSLCLPSSPVDGVKLPVDVPACPDQQDPSTADPSDTPTDQPSADPTDSSTSQPIVSGSADEGYKICAPVPEHLLKQMPLALIRELPHEVPTCIPACASATVLNLIKKLPDDVLSELIDDITTAVGELPDCLLSALPGNPAPSEPGTPPAHRHRHKLPHINTHIPAHAGPATPVDESPDYTG